MILRYAATPEEMQASIDADEPPPPIYSLTDYGISTREHGFLLLGGCPNGDPIAMDVASEPGSVWYIGHETMHGKPLREVSVRAPGDLDSFFEDMQNDDFPFDSFEARNRGDSLGD